MHVGIYAYSRALLDITNIFKELLKYDASWESPAQNRFENKPVNTRIDSKVWLIKNSLFARQNIFTFSNWVS